MIALLVLLWLAASLVLGYPLVRIALEKEDRLSVLAFAGLGVGHSLQALLLVLAWRWVPLGSAIYVVCLLSLGAGFALLSRSRITAITYWGMSRAATTWVLALMVVYALLGYQLFAVATHAGATESLFQHSAMVDWLERGIYPPTAPLEPDDPLHYRIGLYALGAGLASGSGSWAPHAMSAAIAIIAPMLVLFLVGASLRLFDDPRPGILGALAGMFGGSLYPYYRLIQAISGNGEFGASDLGNGVLWQGSTVDMLHVNPSIAAGLCGFVLALWLCAEALRQKRFSLASHLVAALGLAYLGLYNEVHFVALATAVAGFAGLAALRQLRCRHTTWWRVPAQALLILLAAATALTAVGGLLGGAGAVGGKPGSVQLTLNTDHLGYLVHGPMYLKQAWVPMFSVETAVETDFALLVLPILTIIAWRRSIHFAVMGYFASAILFIAWATVYPGYFPHDAYRFGQAAMTVFLILSPFVVCSIGITWKHEARQILSRVGSGMLLLLILPHLTLAAVMLLASPDDGFLATTSPDTMAAAYLRGFGNTSRVLVPTRNPDGGWHAFQTDESFVRTAGTILAISKHAIPMGHHLGPHNAARYIDTYREASLTFDPAALTALKIDWVYLAPRQLDPDQELALTHAQDSGLLRLEKSFGTPGTSGERLLYRRQYR